ncbi:IS5 family transposase [Streptomyces sp. GbtcB7]|uniref:IS5 family transposase n=1 Tax=Streptomyces sp. GbtcB7 TaxID=2824752 RepID=UPI001C2FF19D|nr:IS5 family transposase [Streptomyces sp. GbtcB7]
MGESRARLSTDLSDAEWEILRPLVPAVKPGGRPPGHTRRQIVNALASWLRAGCAWRLLPHDLPPWQTTYHYWRQWRRDGLWERMLTELRERERLRLGRDPTPSAGIMDSQSVRATERGGLYGYDGGKKVNGIKRHLLVDTLGTVLLACVSPANVDDRDGAEVLLCQAADNFPRLKHIWADQGYRGADFHAWIRQATGITVQIVQRRDGGFRRTWAKAGAPLPEVPYFAVVQRRWVVERTFAWLGRCRRLSKDYEYLRVNSENVIYLAMAMLLLRRLARTPR